MKRKSIDLGAGNDSGRRQRDGRNGIATACGPEWASGSPSGGISQVGLVSSSSVENRLVQPAMELAVIDMDMTDADVDDQGDMTLRQWLSRPGRIVDRVACLHIFKQVLEFVELAQSQGVMLRTIRPSCFIISPLHRVTFIECGSSSDKSSEHSTGRASEAPEHELGRFITDNSVQQAQVTGTDNRLQRRALVLSGPSRVGRVVEQGGSSGSEYQRGEATGTGHSEDHWTSSLDPSDPSSQEMDDNFPLREVLSKEQIWYTSPEELAGGTSSFASDIYSLGVLFFELFCTFSSNMEWSRAMSDLRHRILPPRILSECPKEAALCLWLLHPEPQSRPKAKEVLQCELLSEAGEALAEREAAADIEEREADSALLLDFLLRVQQEKQEAALKLSQAVEGLSTDIKAVEKRRAVLRQKGLSAGLPEKERIRNLGARDESFVRPRRNRLDFAIEPQDEFGEQRMGVPGQREGKRQGEVLSRSARLMSNFSQLEQAYFSMRWKVDPQTTDVDTEPQGGGAGVSSMVASSSSNQKHFEASSEAGSSKDRLGKFFDSLCKYARYSRFEVKATLRHGDLLNTANMVCSLSFDRDEEFFATAGVCKKIKVFECDSVLNEHVDIHYPVVEMTSRSKLSSICWNSYIKSHLASSDYDGVIQLWDANTSQKLVEYKEHEKRAWSVDFSHADPTKLASGSDDCFVKLWSINQEASIGTIKTKANVCCVQFPSDSAHLLAFGSADYKIYCYDLRHTKAPLCVLASHNKAVSYVRFVDAVTLVSASTDSTLKLWDLSKVLRNGVVNNACGLTYSGHLNEKNFVGLSVADGYIACGSETNTVFCYHKSLPMPLATHKFGSSDPVSGQENEDDGGQFVSSVCWRGKSQTLVAANSMGNIKVLELV